jgi:hypothetical protein
MLQHFVLSVKYSDKGFLSSSMHDFFIARKWHLNWFLALKGCYSTEMAFE